MPIATPYILVVDDHRSTLCAVEELLKDLGGKVALARSGEEALALLEEGGHKFALVLLDVHMPGLDGFETHLRIKRHESQPAIPVIFLSGRPTEDNVLRAYREGAVDFLAKPLVPEILRSKVRVFLDLFLAREALSQRERFLSAVTEAAPEIIYVYDLAERRNLFLNRDFASYLGYSTEQIAAMDSSDMEAFIHPDDLAACRSDMQKIAQADDGEIQRREFRMRDAAGDWRWIAGCLRPFARAADGTFRSLVGTAHDITEQRRADEEIRRLNAELERRIEERTRALGDAEERLRLLMENATEHAIFTTDPVGRVLEWNTGAERIFGYAPEEIVGESLSLLFVPEDREVGVPEEEMRKAADTGRAMDERWHLKKSGERFFASGVSTALRDESGNLRGFAKICRDLTGQKMAQEALLESEQRLQLVIDSLPALIAYLDRDLRYRFVNLTFETWLGVGRDQVIGKHISEIAGPLVTTVLRPYLEQVLGGQRVHLRSVVPYATGTREIEGDYIPSRNEQGQVEGFAVLMTDITARAREEHQRQFLLDASTTIAGSLDYEATLRRVARMAVPTLAHWCAVDVMDTEGRVRRVAVAHPDPRKERLAADLDRLYPTFAGSEEGAARVIRTGEPQLVSDVTDAMLEASARDGGHLALLRQLDIRSYLCVPLLARGGAVGALTFVSSDAGLLRYGPDDLRFAEELARRSAAAIDNAMLHRAVKDENAQRREAEARLANAHEEVLRASQAKSAFLSSMSHELRTPLNAIIGYTELLQETMVEDGDRRASDDLAKIETSARHLLALINDVLDLAKVEAGKVELDRTDVDVAAVLEEVVSTILPLAERNANRIETACPDDAGTIRTDPTRLRQILFNLLSNAAKFTHNGVIRIECVRGGGQGEEWIELRVEDTGPGIAESETAMLFEKFQQLDAGKKHGGTGLGLAITRLLARALGGDVHVRSELGRGSTFTVRLPVAGDPERFAH